MSIVLSDLRIAGHGAYGKVFAGSHNSKRLATKRRYIVDHASVPPGCVHVNEVDVMCRIKHPHILHAIAMQKQNPIPDSFKNDKANPGGIHIQNTVFRADLVYLISDAADGDLSSFAIGDDAKVVDVDTKGVRVKDELRRYMWQILTAIAHLHAKGYIHRDIKPSNILYFDEPVTESTTKKSTSDEYIRNIRICDFDMCLPNIACLETAKAMTPEYTPPEVLVQGANVIYTPKVDIWGAGHVLYHLIKGESLIRRGSKRGDELDTYILATEKVFFPNGNKIKIPDNLTGIVDTIIRSELEDSIIPFDLGDNETNDLLTHMLDCDPESRWSAIQCLQHPFFQSKTIPKDLYPPNPNVYGDTLVEDHIIEKHFITEEMAQVFDSQIDILSDNELFGFFLGLDIMIRVCSKKYRGNGRNLAICCFNLGMKFFDKETAKFMRIDNEDAKRIEYNIISTHLSGKIYRDTVYNHLNRDYKRIYRYLLAPDLLPNKLSTLINVIRKALDT